MGSFAIADREDLHFDKDKGWSLYTFLIVSHLTRRYIVIVGTFYFISASINYYRNGFIGRPNQYEMDSTRSASGAGGVPGQPAGPKVLRRAAEAENETRRLRWKKRNEITQAEVSSPP